jgi:hypothetical protein
MNLPVEDIPMPFHENRYKIQIYCIKFNLNARKNFTKPLKIFLHSDAGEQIVFQRVEGCRHNKSTGCRLHITVVELGLWRRLWCVSLAAVVSVFRCSSMRILWWPVTRRPYVQ